MRKFLTLNYLVFPSVHLLLILTIVTCNPAYAQKKDSSNKPDGTRKALAKPHHMPVINHIEVYPTVHRDSIGFGDRLEVFASDLDSFDDKVYLYIDGYQTSNIGQVIKANGIINFTLNRDEANKVLWNWLFQKARKNGGLVLTDIAIGNKDSTWISNTLPLTIEIYRRAYIKGTIIGFMVLLVLILLVGFNTDILREDCRCTCPDKKAGVKCNPFSLARTQMAFWTLIIGFSLVYIYFGTGIMPLVTDGSLVLLGISATTALAGKLVDNRNTESAAINDGTPQVCCSQGFLLDILSDSGKMGIHRFQNVVFTLILGIVYMIKVCNNLEMPDFSTNTLLLIGISSGTYVGVKYVVTQPLESSPKAEVTVNKNSPLQQAGAGNQPNPKDLISTDENTLK